MATAANFGRVLDIYLEVTELARTPPGEVPWDPDTMTHRYPRYADRVEITSSLKETRRAAIPTSGR